MPSISPHSPLLLSLDGGDDAIENIKIVLKHNDLNEGQADVDFLIKWNPRKQNKADWRAE